MKPVKRKDKKAILDGERKHVCVACNKESFHFNCQLRYHIRQHHFNCIGLAPCADTQNVNDAWVEKVENTDTLVEIIKVSSNELLIQKVKDDTIQPTKMRCEVIDVRKYYPVCSGSDGVVECRVCQKSFGRKKLSKHFAAKHALLVKKRCDTCDTPFRRLFNCAIHICPESSIKGLIFLTPDKFAQEEENLMSILFLRLQKSAVGKSNPKSKDLRPVSPLPECE